MKIRIVKAANGAKTGPKPKYKNLKPHPGDKTEKWNASSLSEEEIRSAAEELGYNGPDNVRSFQQWILANKDIPEIRAKIDAAHEKYGMPNAGRKDDGYLGIRWNFLKPGKEADPVDMPDYDPNAFVPPTTKEKAEYVGQEGNKYSFKDNGAKKKPYQKEQMPFYQTIPELMGFASSLNTYNYQTPDYQHWEMTPNKLNVQPQIQSIDSSLNAITNTTTGSPQLDYARKMGAFTQATNAKQQVYGNKQNYDAEKEFQAKQFNNTARTQEQNLDVNAQNQIYNEFMPLAKDAAAGERIAAISSLTTKYAKHAVNEEKKKLWLNNFYNNVQVNPDGTIETVGTHDFSEDFQPVTPKKAAIKNPMTGEKIDVIPPITNPDKVGPITGYKNPGTGTTPRINTPKRPFSIIQDVPVEEEATNIFGIPNILPSSIRKNRNSR